MMSTDFRDGFSPIISACVLQYHCSNHYTPSTFFKYTTPHISKWASSQASKQSCSHVAEERGGRGTHSTTQGSQAACVQVDPNRVDRVHLVEGLHRACISAPRFSNVRKHLRSRCEPHTSWSGNVCPSRPKAMGGSLLYVLAKTASGRTMALQSNRKTARTRSRQQANTCGRVLREGHSPVRLAHLPTQPSLLKHPHYDQTLRSVQKHRTK